MSEIPEQTDELRELAAALIEARGELSKAEAAANAYADAVVAGTEAANVARAAELEANRAFAKAVADKAAAVVRAEADGSAAAARAAAETKKAAEVAKAAEADRARAAEAAARAIEAAKKREEAAQNALAQKSQAVKGLAIGAIGGEETVEKYNKMREALRLAGDASLSGGQRAAAMASGLKFAAGTAAALGNVALGVGQSLIQLSLDTHKVNAEIFEYQQRTNALAPSLAALRQATGGAVDVQAAFAMQTALTERNIAAQGEALVATMAAARQYAASHQQTQEQASQVVQRALDGDRAAAAALGISLGTATTAAQRHATVIQQLAAQQRQAAPATANAAEAARVQAASTEHAHNVLKSWAGSALRYVVGLDRLEQAANDFTRANENSARSQRDATAATVEQTRADEAAKRQREALARATEQHTADRMRSLTIERGAAQEELQRHGIRIASLGQTVSAQQQYTRALFDANHARIRADETGEQFAQRQIKLQRDLLTSVQRLNAEQSRQDSLRRAEAEAGMLARQLRAHGMVVSARIASITPAERLLQVQRELATFAGRESEMNDQTLARFQQLAQEAEALRQRGIEAANRARDTRDAQEEYNALVSTADRLEIKRATTQRRAGEQQLEYLQRVIPLQRELVDAEWARRDAEREALTAAREADARLAASRAAQVAQENEASNTEIQRRAQALGELNVQRETWANEAANSSSLRALEARTRNAITGGDSEVITREIRARAEMMEQLYANGADRTQEGAARLERLRAEAEAVQRIGTSWRDASDATLAARQAFGFAQDQSLTATQAMVGAAKSAYDAFGELGVGIVEALRQAEKAGEDGGAAVAKQVDTWAEAKAVQWGLQALEALAGAGVAYFIRPDAVPGLLASAASYATLAGIAAATSLAIPNAPPSAASGGGGDRSRGSGMVASSRSEPGMERGQSTYIFNVSGLIHTEQVTEAVAGVVRDAEARGLLGR